MRLLLISFALLMAAAIATAQRSPEVHEDRSVTFRLKMPHAERVDLSLEGVDSVRMTKGVDGWWTYSSKPLSPDLYGYNFNVDGTTVLDPQNPLMKPNLIWPSNMVLVPGKELWEVRDVPHGTVHRHAYKSNIIGDHRDFYVYTPPGYTPGDRKNYPVLYLLHGFSDTANGWTSVGQAHTILDNLIAEGKSKPMMVVMTLGYGVPDFASPGSLNFRSPELTERNYANFSKALLTEVRPMVEKEYRASKTERAIAGLSMGGAESLYTAFNNPRDFSYVGAFSSGGFNLEQFKAINSRNANYYFKELWISCGTEDGLIAANRELDKWLTDQNIKHAYREVPGRHTWMVWRRNLADFCQRLFR